MSNSNFRAGLLCSALQYCTNLDAAVICLPGPASLSDRLVPVGVPASSVSRGMRSSEEDGEPAPPAAGSLRLLSTNGSMLEPMSDIVDPR
ncbi:hypothetical protein BC826DRAFT_1045877 [Russula brevipes]|nr:hypothetical protein BC826DRAFT_1045877 [Russula brevipes]